MKSSIKLGRYPDFSDSWLPSHLLVANSGYIQAEAFSKTGLDGITVARQFVIYTRFPIISGNTGTPINR